MDSSSPSSISRSLAFALALHATMFTGSLVRIWTEMTKENKSAFEVNRHVGYMMIIPIMALFAVEVTSWIPLFKTITSRCYSILKFIDVFMAFLAPFSLLIVSYPPTEQNRLVSLIPCIIMAMALAYNTCGDDEKDKSVNKTSPFAIYTYYGLVIVPVMFMTVLFIPRSLDSIVFPLLHLSFGVEMICFLVMWFSFMMKI